MLPVITGLADSVMKKNGFEAATVENGDFAQLLSGNVEDLEALAEQLQLPVEQLSPAIMAYLQQWTADGNRLPTTAIADLKEAMARYADQMTSHIDSYAARHPMLNVDESVLLEKNITARNLLANVQERVENMLQSRLQLAAPMAQPDHLTLPPVSGQAPSVLTAAMPISPALAGNLLGMAIPQQVASQGWDKAVGERLIWMARGDKQLAELKLNPPNLGPMEVKLTINNDQASVSFVSSHVLVRDALEQAIPRLREMLEQQDIDLVDVSVGEQHAQGEGAADGSGAGGDAAGDPMGAGGLDGDGESLVGTPIVDASGLGLIDLFA